MVKPIRYDKFQPDHGVFCLYNPQEAESLYRGKAASCRRFPLTLSFTPIIQTTTYKSIFQIRRSALTCGLKIFPVCSLYAPGSYAATGIASSIWTRFFYGEIRVHFDNRRASAYYQDHAVADSPAACRLQFSKLNGHRMSFAQIQLISVILAEIIFIIDFLFGGVPREWRYSIYVKTTGILMGYLFLYTFRPYMLRPFPVPALAGVGAGVVLHHHDHQHTCL